MQYFTKMLLSSFPFVLLMYGISLAMYFTFFIRDGLIRTFVFTTCVLFVLIMAYLFSLVCRQLEHDFKKDDDIIRVTQTTPPPNEDDFIDIELGGEYTSNLP